MSKATIDSTSEFPSLSGNQPQQSSSSGQSTWAMPGLRGLNQATTQQPSQQPLLSMQQQVQGQQQSQQKQDDLFASSSQLAAPQASFRFRSQPAVGPSSQPQANTTDEFPPLSRNINGEIGQDRSLGLLQNVNFAAPSSGSVFGGPSGSQATRNNGLLNALSGNSRAPLQNARIASPGTMGGMVTLSGL